LICQRLVTVCQMARTGLVLNLFSTLVIGLVIWVAQMLGSIGHR
jgi:hypothetical protein